MNPLDPNVSTEGSNLISNNDSNIPQSITLRPDNPIQMKDKMSSINKSPILSNSPAHLKIDSHDSSIDSKLIEISENSDDVEKIIGIAEKLGLILDDSPEGMRSLEGLKSTLLKFLVTTKSTMKTVKEKILNESWVPNRELLHQAMRKLQISRAVIEP